MTRHLFRILCCLLAPIALVGSAPSIAAQAQAQNLPDGPKSGPLAPHGLRLDPSYSTVLFWSQERNPPHYVRHWNIYLDGKLQKSLRTNRYNMPKNGRQGTYTITAETHDGITSPLSKSFTVGNPDGPKSGPLAPHGLRLDPSYSTVLFWSQERNPPHYVRHWNIYLDGKLQKSLRTNRYNMPKNGRQGTYTITAETHDGITSPLSKSFTVGNPAPTTTTAGPAPETTATPATTGAPSTTATSTTAGTPATTATPVTTGAPTTTKAPTTTAAPATTKAPTTIATPATTAAPTTTAAPATTTTAAPTNPAGLVWGYDATAPDPSRVRPSLNTVTTDPIYGTEVRRRTDATGTRFDRNTYSRRQAENADGTYYLTYHGNATNRVYSRATNDLVSETAIDPNGEPQWHPTNPALVRHIKGGNSYVGDLRLYETNVVTGNTAVIADLTSRIQARMPSADYMKDRSEGSPSVNGNRYAWMVYDSTEKPIGLVSYDLGTDTVLGLAVGLNQGLGALDHISMSPTGGYVVASYGSGTRVYDADLTNERVVNFKTDHSDIALDADGSDAYVYIDFSSGPDAGYLVSVNLDTLVRTRIFRIYGGANTSVHISGKGYGKPGWVLVSTYNCKNAGAWTCDKVMAVEIAENGRVLNLAHTYNCGQSYWTETHAVVNRDFTRAYFNTDSGSCGIDAEVMEITIPDFD